MFSITYEKPSECLKNPPMFSITYKPIFP
jgi:hypothetical protein